MVDLIGSEFVLRAALDRDGDFRFFVFPFHIRRYLGVVISECVENPDDFGDVRGHPVAEAVEGGGRPLLERDELRCVLDRAEARGIVHSGEMDLVGQGEAD